MLLNVRAKEKLPVGTRVRIVSTIPDNREALPHFTDSMKPYLGKAGTIVSVVRYEDSWYRIEIDGVESTQYNYLPEWFEVL